MFEKAIADIRFYASDYENLGLLKTSFYLIFRQEMYAVLIYRLGRWANYECNIPVINKLFRIIYFFLRKIGEIFIGVGIWPESDIAPGFKVEHYGGVYIMAKIGRNCRVSQLVVIGHVGGYKGGGVPTLGDNVYVGAGAKILGDITIGDNAIIGANAVVLKDVPANGVAVGVPARVIKIRA